MPSYSSRNHLITLTEAQGCGDPMYIVHQVNPLDSAMDQQIHLESDQHDDEEHQVIEMDEFIQMKQSQRLKGGVRTRHVKIKKEAKEKQSPLRGVKTHKNFSDSWLSSSVFKHWLEKHPSSNNKAICRVCNKVLLAGKSELLKHGASKKHMQFMQASTGWVKRDDSQDFNDNSADVSSDAGNGFLDEWLEDPLFQDWIMHYPDSMYKAMCKACNKVLLATKSELMKHRTQKRHRENMNTLRIEESAYGNTGAMDTFEEQTEISTNENDYTLEGIRCSIVLIKMTWESI